MKIDQIRPALGIELFVLEAPKVDDILPRQEALWAGKPGLDNQSVIQLLDRVVGKMGADVIHRYVPAAHYWLERSANRAVSITDNQLSLGISIDRVRLNCSINPPQSRSWR